MDIFMYTIFAILLLLVGMIMGSFITFYVLYRKRMRDEKR